MKQEIINKTDNEINELLPHIELNQLQAFIAQYAFLNSAFKKDILNYFNPQSPQKTLAQYRGIASGVFNFEKPGRYGRGYDFYAAASEAADELGSLMEKAKYFIAQNNFEEAAAIAQSIIEAIPQHYEMVDDSNGELGGIFNDAVGLLLKIAENETAGTELKKEICRWVGNEMKKSIYDDYGFDEIHSLLIPYTQVSGLYKEALAIADERIQQAGNDYRLERAVNEKIQMLQKSNCMNDAESVIDSYINLVSIRKLRINTMLAKNHYTEAIHLIEEGIKAAEQQAHPGTVSDWKNQLLEIYITMGDNSNILKYAEDLFYTGRDAINYYHILKNEIKTDKWKAYLDTLLSKRQAGGWLGGHPDNVLAQIYIEETYWDRLLQLVEKSDLSGMETYEKYLKTHFPDQLRDLFVKKLMVYAERNMGRDHYRYVAAILRKIRTYPEGRQVTDKLLAEFKIKYKARRAMMEELRGV